MKMLYDNIHNYSEKNYADFLLNIKNEKKNKMDKIINTDNKKRSLLGEHLFYILLSKQNINYKYVTLYKNKYGKSFIQNYDLFYNISHSYDYSTCVTSNHPIGIDIEKIRKVPKNTINQFATTNEMKYINTDNGKSIYMKMFEIYTLKESYFKCLGTNLNNVKNVEFIIDKNKVLCSDSEIIANIFYNLDGYIISTCETKNKI